MLTVAYVFSLFRCIAVLAFMYVGRKKKLAPEKLLSSRRADLQRAQEYFSARVANRFVS